MVGFCAEGSHDGRIWGRMVHAGSKGAIMEVAGSSSGTQSASEEYAANGRYLSGEDPPKKLCRDKPQP